MLSVPYRTMLCILLQPRAATITAVETTQVLKLDRATFKRLLGPVEAILKASAEVRVLLTLQTGS